MPLLRIIRRLKSKLCKNLKVGFDGNEDIAWSVSLKTKQGGKIHFGEGVIVRGYSEINAKTGEVNIGRHCFISRNTWIGGVGSITIGENCLLGMNVVIICSNHNYKKIHTPWHTSPEVPNSVTIGKNVWIGANSVVLPGASIGNNVVIGAGVVVEGNVPDGTKVVSHSRMVENSAILR